MKSFHFAAGLTVLALAGFLSQGCETESADENDVRITPAAIGLSVNQTQRFVASGGYQYTWSLSDNTIGALTTATGPETLYINRAAVATNGTPLRQILTVTSRLSSQTTTDSQTSIGTNDVVLPSGSGFTKSATALIEHLP